MRTTIWNVNNDVDKKSRYAQLQEAADRLRNGEVVAFPTETVYGLGADATSTAAVEKIFEAKGRPSDNPLIVHIAEKEALSPLVSGITKEAEALINAFWPGPLTIIFPKKPGVFSDRVTAGLETVGIRMPDHPVARDLIREADKPIAAPSANRSGKPSPTQAEHVVNDLNGRIAGVVDGGGTGVGVESTVIDCSVTPPMILRPGGVSAEAIARVIGDVTVDPSLKTEEQAPRSPGMKYTHYAPTAPLYLVDGDLAWFQSVIDKWEAEGHSVGVLATVETLEQLRTSHPVSCGHQHDEASIARALYHAIRSFDDMPVDVILAERFSEKGLGAAIMNRLEKAAGHKVEKQV